MEEKVLIESKSYKHISTITLFICFVALIIGLVFISQYHTTYSYYAPYYGTYLTSDHYDSGMLFGSIVCFTVSIFFLIIFAMTFRVKIMVSNTRVSGRAMFGKQVDIPMDAVSAVGKLSLWKGVSISSSSGIIRFFLLKNADEIFTVVGQLLQERTKDNKSVGASIDDLKKYKDLYESGVITAEEFEAKKKQILGL